MTIEYVIEYLLVNIIWIYIIYKYMGVFFEVSIKSNKEKIIVYISFYLVNSTLNLVFHNPVCNILTSLLGIYCITTLYKSHIARRIVATFMIYIISMICDIVVATVVSSYTLGMRMNVVNNILSYLLIFTVEMLVEKYMQFRSGYILQKKHIWAIIGVPASSMLIIMALVISGIRARKIMVLVSFVLLLINFLVMYLYETLLKDYEKMYKSRFLEQEVAAYRGQIELIEASQKKIDRLRHDMKHHLFAISGMANLGETEKIQSYIGKMIENTGNDKEYVATGNADVDSILNYMIQKAKDKGIEVGISVKIATELCIDCFDLTVILCNLLENAIEAAEKAEKKYIKIGLDLECNILFIDVENSYSGEIIKKDDGFATTKTGKNSHGFGMGNINTILQKYDGCMNIKHDDAVFTVNAMMYLAIEESNPLISS